MNTVDKCIICGGRDFALFRGGACGGDVWECRCCGLVFINPQPDEAELAGRYDDAYYAPWQSLTQQARRQRLWQRRLKVVAQVCPSGRLLDVGCGDGLFLHCAARAGYEVRGTEISAHGSKYAAEKYGLTVENCALEECSLTDGTFDIITFWHSLEHMRAPDRNLIKARRLLKPGGFLLAAVPNVNDALARFLYRLIKRRDYCMSAEGTREPHLFWFSTVTLEMLVAKCGYCVVKTGADVSQVDLRWKLVERVSHGLSLLSGTNVDMAILVIARGEP